MAPSSGSHGDSALDAAWYRYGQQADGQGKAHAPRKGSHLTWHSGCKKYKAVLFIGFIEAIRTPDNAPDSSWSGTSKWDGTALQSLVFTTGIRQVLCANVIGLIADIDIRLLLPEGWLLLIISVRQAHPGFSLLLWSRV